MIFLWSEAGIPPQPHIFQHVLSAVRSRLQIRETLNDDCNNKDVNVRADVTHQCQAGSARSNCVEMKVVNYYMNPGSQVPHRRGTPRTSYICNTLHCFTQHSLFLSRPLVVFRCTDVLTLFTIEHGLFVTLMSPSTTSPAVFNTTYVWIYGFKLNIL